MTDMKEEKPRITLGFQYNDRTVKLKTRLDQPFKKMFEAIEAAFRVQPNTFRYRTGEDTNIAGEDTPAEHNMEDMEIIDVFVFQHGGAFADSLLCTNYDNISCDK